MIMSRVLTIEDDEITANEIVGELKSRGFTVDWVANGREGMVRAITETRRGDARSDVARRGRPDDPDHHAQHRHQTPVLMLSAFGDVDERVRGLRAGGDDYLTKPFAPEEMAARLEVLLRRSQTPTAQLETHLRVGPLEIDLISRKVRATGRKLLAHRVPAARIHDAARGADVTRTMMFEAVWGYHFDPGTNLIDVHMGRLRKKSIRPGRRR